MKHGEGTQITVADETTIFVTITCAHTGHPMVGRLVWDGQAFVLIAASKQRPGSVIPDEGKHWRQAVYRVHTSYRCPQCHASSMIQCGQCKALCCWEESWQIVSCPRCGQSNRRQGDIQSLSGGRG